VEYICGFYSLSGLLQWLKYICARHCRRSNIYLGD